jgi:hypothetical protein
VQGGYGALFASHGTIFMSIASFAVQAFSKVVSIPLQDLMCGQWSGQLTDELLVPFRKQNAPAKSVKSNLPLLSVSW